MDATESGTDRGLTDEQLLDALVVVGDESSGDREIVRCLLSRFGSLRGILEAPREQLDMLTTKHPRIKMTLGALRETVSRCSKRRSGTSTPSAGIQELSGYWRRKLGTFHTEVFEVAYFDSALRLLPNGIERTSEGTIDRAAVYPRRILESALFRGASVIVLAHNHPNGDVTPTEHDRVVTRAIVLAAHAIDVRVLDHLVVSTAESFSFKANGLL